MSKYTDELRETFPNIKDIKKRTKEIIEGGRDLAFKEFHNASSLERIKKHIMDDK